MFTLEIPAEKLNNFDKLMNQNNVNYRIDEFNKNNSVVVIKLKTQDKFNSAQEIIKKL